MLVLSTNETHPTYSETFFSHYCIKKTIQTYIKLKGLYNEYPCTHLTVYHVCIITNLSIYPSPNPPIHYSILICDAFQSKVQISVHFIPNYFSMHIIN